MTTKYQNLPIVEAVCEFKFFSEGQNDSIIPGMLFTKFSKEFPIVKKKNLGLVIPVDENEREKDLVFNPLTQFFNEENTKIIQVGKDLLTINCVNKYPHWENYKPLILKVFDEYISLANPTGIKRLGIRAINKISIPSEDLNLKDYFSFSPVSPFKDDNKLAAFILHIERSFFDDRDRLIMKNMTIVPEKEAHTSFLFDLDYVMKKATGLNFSEVSDWLEIAHNTLNDAFEISITDKLRDTFGKIQ